MSLNTLHTEKGIKLNKVIRLVWLPLLFAAIAITSGGCKQMAEPNVHGNSHTSLCESIASEDTLHALYKLLHLNPSDTRKTAMELLDSIGQTCIRARIELLKHIGTSYLYEENYVDAMRYYTLALAKADSVNSREQFADINNNLGIIHRRVGNIKSALIHFTEASNYFQELGDHRKQQGTYINKGLIYLNVENVDKASSYFIKAYNGFQAASDTIGILTALNNISLVHLSREEHDEAVSCIYRAIELAEQTNNKFSVSISKHTLGYTYLSLGDKDNAIRSFTESKSIAEDINQPYRLAHAKLGIARVHHEAGKFDEALELSNEVMAMALDLENESLQSEVHMMLSDTYDSIGDYQNSLLHYRAHMGLNEDMLNQTNIHTVYDFELTNLSQANKLQQLELERKELTISKKNTMLWSAILLFLIFVSGLYLLYLNYRNRQRVKFQQAMLRLTEKKSRAAVEAEIQERKRIGQELHDGLGQLLSVTGLHISVLQKKKDLSEDRRGQLLASAMKSIDNAFSEVRHISHNLAPSLLSERGLKGALKNLTDQVNQSKQLHMGFETYGLDRKLGSVVENTLFRAIQEILNNVIKHSSSDKVSFQLIQSATDITLMAEDNGKGFDPDTISSDSGNGLTHMKTRIENLNGSMHIDSNPGRGTTICIVIPLNTADNVRKIHQSISG